MERSVMLLVIFGACVTLVSGQKMENAGDVVAWCKETDYKGSIGMVTKVYVNSTKVNEFKEFMTKHAGVAKTENGYIRFKVNTDYTRGDIFWVVEEWASPSALIAHGESDWFQNHFLKVVPTLVDANAPMQIGFYLLDAVTGENPDCDKKCDQRCAKKCSKKCAKKLI